MVKSLRFLKSQITKAFNRANSMADYNTYSLRHFLNELEQNYHDFREHFSMNEEADLPMNEFEEYEDKYDQAVVKLQEEIDKRLQRPISDNLNVSNNGETRLMASLLERQQELNETIGRIASHMPKSTENRLPALKIPHFSGNHRDWLQFKNIFLSRVESNATLSSVEKLGHLMSLVEGEAASLIKNLPFVSESYLQAWETLKTKYDKPFKIANNLISELVKAPAVNSKQSFRAFYNLFNETVSALDSLGGYCKLRDPWIIFLVVEKLDKRMRDKWAHELATDKDPSLGFFQEFLEAEDDALDSFDSLEISGREKTGGSRSSIYGKSFKSNSTFSISCFVCNENHRIFKCEKFKQMTVKNRLELVKSKNRCINCLGTGHFVGKCFSKGCCSKCGQKHHTLLHRLQDQNSKNADANGSDTNDRIHDGEMLRVNASLSSFSESSVLPTAIIEVLCDGNRFIKCRALLDTGSQASFITEKCMQRLNLKRARGGVTYETMSSSVILSSRGSVCSMFRSCYDKNCVFSSTLNIVNRITGVLPSKYEKFVSKNLLKSEFQLADPNFDTPSGVDILLGAASFFEIVKSQKYYHTKDRIWVLESSLGWLVCGGGSTKPDTSNVNCNFVKSSDERLEDLVKMFWDLDSLIPFDKSDPDDAYCEEHYKSTTKRLSNGRFSVSLPFRKDGFELGNSYHLARSRFRSLESRLKSDDWYRIEYVKLIEHFKSNDFVEKIQSSGEISDDSRKFYLSHHGVGHGKSKLRIVFDASMKSDNGIALNDVLLRGPNLLPDLRTLLIEFRFHRFVFVSDIKKMYRQILVNEDCRSAQRFFWRDSEEEDIAEYQIITVTDGLSCSPFLALRTMDQLAEEERKNFPKAAIHISKRYMDDFFIGHNSLSELKDIKTQLVGLLKTACMSLSKWCANSDELLEDIEAEDKLSSEHLEIRSNSTIKTLGVNWNHSEDIFSYSFDWGPLSKFSKRILLSDSAKIYDPLGWITPVSVAFKMLFQEACIHKLQWDDVLPEEIVKNWVALRNEIDRLKDLRIDRWLDLRETVEYHGFCDASLKAYACVVYARSIGSDGRPKINIVMAKSRVAPLKPVTVARLELCAAHLLAKSLRFILDNTKGVRASVSCWTDSTTVLAWLASHPTKWKSFVANRCGEIHEMLPSVVWNYVKSADNPADVASRGTLPGLLIGNDLWWFGPFHLKTFNIDGENISTKEITLERKLSKEKCCFAARNDFWNSYCSRYSSYFKLVRVLVHILRFTKFRDELSNEISSKEMNFASEFLIERLQGEHYGKEIANLRERKMVSRKSFISSLDPFLDEKGLVRAGGRLLNAPICYNTKFPIIIPNSTLVRPLIRYYHEIYYHASKKLLIGLLRQKYWICRINSEVKFVINNCVRCRAQRGVTFAPKMGPIPESRLNPKKPFLHTGIDFAGPIVIRPYKGRGKMTIKGYVAVMVCMVTKALHLELVFGLDTESFLNALKRFVARRGRCAKLSSDNGTNFISSNNRISKLKIDIRRLINDKDTKTFLLEQLMDWEFIPPGSPHMGGLWEASVKSVKTFLSKKFEKLTPTIEEFNTALAEIESLLNSRPLFAISKDTHSFEVITPAHLIFGYPTTILPTHEDLSEDISHLKLSKRYSYLRNILKSFWCEWSKSYFHELRRIYKWRSNGQEPKVNDVVLVKRSNQPISCWPRGVIVEVFPGRDGIIRVVKVRTQSSVKVEACRNLIPLVVEA